VGRGSFRQMAYPLHRIGVFARLAKPENGNNESLTVAVFAFSAGAWQL